MVHAVKALVNFARGTATRVFVETTLDAGGDALHGVVTKGGHLAEEQDVDPAPNEKVDGFLQAGPKDLQRTLSRSVVLTGT